MAFLDVKLHQEQHNFDWDDINVGNIQLNHSQNFFSNKHYEHERRDEMEFLQQKITENETVENDTCFDDKENIKGELASLDDKQNERNKTCNTTADGTVDLKANQEPNRKIIANNLACEWSISEPVCSQALLSKGGVSKNIPPPPKAYLVKDIYQRKREEAERRRAEEEKKLREFHSRPAPKFNHNEHLMKRKPVHSVTVAVTPQVLKKSREADEKRRKRMEEWKQKNQPPKFEPRPPTVLKEKPFVPEKKPIVVQQCPFNLRMEKRLQERKQYDEIKQKALEEKQKQEEQERKRLETQRIKELRKATTFKAKPNPFKH